MTNLPSENIDNLNLNVFTCSPRDICRLCEFAKNATDMDDDFSKGMRSAFQYIINCMDASQPVYDHMGKIKELKMDEKATRLVTEYVLNHLDKSDPKPEFEVFTVWKCKALQNWKYLLSTTLFDGMYYELTYNGDKKEWYLDAYKKFENQRIPD